MNLSELIKKAPTKHATESFKGLFEVDFLIAGNQEIKEAIESSMVEVMNKKTGAYGSDIDAEQLRDFLVSKVAGFKGLTLQMAMTLCSKEMPSELEGKAKVEIQADKATVETLMINVVGFQAWALSQLKTLGAEQARREAAAAKNS